MFWYSLNATQQLWPVISFCQNLHEVWPVVWAKRSQIINKITPKSSTQKKVNLRLLNDFWVNLAEFLVVKVAKIMTFCPILSNCVHVLVDHLFSSLSHAPNMQKFFIIANLTSFHFYIFLKRILPLYWTLHLFQVIGPHLINESTFNFEWPILRYFFFK